MIGVSILPQIIRATILSTFAEAGGITPVSLFVVAPFESGKTRLVLENSAEDSLILTDLTGIGLLEALQMNSSATTVVINDLSIVTSHRNSVSHLTISILNGLAEEGTYKIAMPKMAHLDLKGRRVNIIACCVPDMVSDHRNWWYRSGFMSRLLTISFNHSISLQLDIHKAIQSGTEDNRASILVVPAAPIAVHFGQQESAELAGLATRVFQAHGEVGYRKHKQIRGLAAGHAISRTWKHPRIEKVDIDFIKQCLPFLIEGSQI